MDDLIFECMWPERYGFPQHVQLTSKEWAVLYTAAPWVMLVDADVDEET